MVRVVLGGLRPKGSDPVTIALWVDEKQVQTATHDQENAASFSERSAGLRRPGRPDEGQADGRRPLDLGRHPAHLRRPAGALRRSQPLDAARHTCREFKPPANAPPERLEQLRKRFDDAQAELAKIPLNGVRVSAVEIGGPYSYAKGPSRASLEKVYTCGHLDGTSPGDLHAAHHDRPGAPGVPPSGHDARGREVHRADASGARRKKDSFEEGLAVGIQALLVSPDFLFRIERDRPVTAPATRRTAITPHELATRLSYFLWASMPDAELRRAADAGTLRDPQILAFQVRRMLRDPKAHALAEHFGGQWLQFRALESLTRDRDKFPEFEDYLRLSMRRETELFVEAIVRDDRSVLDFINGRYSFLNERLARHYGIPNVSGPAFRQVDLTGTPRGGVLTQGSILAVSSYATRTSPVLRGKWVLDNLLNAPPPEPPADVPNLDESKIGTAASMREQLEEHRKNAICASCHRRMDPLGFGLENFDAVGAWRTMEGKFPIDASGQLPDGRTFTGPDELRDDPVGRSRRVRARHHVEAADLRARPRPRALRQADGQAHRQPAAELRLQVLRARARDRQQPAVPVAPLRAVGTVRADCVDRVLDPRPLRLPTTGPRPAQERRGTHSIRSAAP